MKILQFPVREQEEDIRDYMTEDQKKLMKAAEEGNMHCMRGLAELFESWWHRTNTADAPTHGPRSNPKTLFRLALTWRVKAARTGDPESMRWLAVYIARYGETYGITDEMAGGSCLEWQVRAAEAGDRYAMKWMGDICADRMDRNYDQVKAEEWYRKSAAAGCIYAIHELGYRREKGIHGPKSDAEAISWYKKSVQALDRWRSLSRVEHEVCVEDLVRVTELSIKLNQLDDLRREWLIEYLNQAEQLMGWDKQEADLMKRVRHARMKLNIVR